MSVGIGDLINSKSFLSHKNGFQDLSNIWSDNQGRPVWQMSTSLTEVFQVLSVLWQMSCVWSFLVSHIFYKRGKNLDRLPCKNYTLRKLESSFSLPCSVCPITWSLTKLLLKFLSGCVPLLDFNTPKSLMFYRQNEIGTKVWCDHILCIYLTALHSVIWTILSCAVVDNDCLAVAPNKGI